MWQDTPPPDNIWNGSKNEWLESLISRAHAKGVKISICVGGDSTYFPQATHSANLTTFVNNIVNFVNVHGFDGVNIDWEYPRNATEWNQCIALLNALKNNLPSRKTITIALSHSKHVYSNYTHVPPQILSIVDGIYLMTYDEGDPAWPSHSNVARSIQA
jgi:GH18 family chitinase